MAIIFIFGLIGLNELRFLLREPRTVNRALT